MIANLDRIFLKRFNLRLTPVSLQIYLDIVKSNSNLYLNSHILNFLIALERSGRNSYRSIVGLFMRLFVRSIFLGSIFFDPTNKKICNKSKSIILMFSVAVEQSVQLF